MALKSTDQKPKRLTEKGRQQQSEGSTPVRRTRTNELIMSAKTSWMPTAVAGKQLAMKPSTLRCMPHERRIRPDVDSIESVGCKNKSIRYSVPSKNELQIQAMIKPVSVRMKTVKRKLTQIAMPLRPMNLWIHPLSLLRKDHRRTKRHSIRLLLICRIQGCSNEKMVSILT